MHHHHINHRLLQLCMQDVLQHAVCKAAVHKAYMERKEKEARARQSLADAAKILRLTGGLMFKFQHTGSDDSVLVLHREMEAKKSSAKISEIAKHIEKYLNKLDKHGALMDAGKGLTSFHGVELNVYCNIRRKKSDGPLPQ